MVSTRPGDDPTPHAGSGAPRRSATQLATDPAFTGTYAAQTDAGPTAGLARLPRWSSASSIVTIAASGHGWLGSTGFITNDTADFVMGSQSMKIPTNGAGGTFKMEKTGLSVDTTGQQIRLRVKYENISHIFTTQFFLSNTDATYANGYSWMLGQAVMQASETITEGEWVTVTLPFSSATSIGTPARSGVAAMKLTVRDDSAGIVTAHLQSVELVAEPSTTFPNGLVSICFDDNWDSSWTLAKPYLDANGLRASHYLISDLLDQSGRVTTAQALTLQRQGHEVCAHSLTNADHTSTFTGLTAAQLDANLKTQATRHRRTGFRGAGTAYPQGAYGFTTDSVSTETYMRRYFSYARTTARRQMETWPPPDPYRIRAQSSIGSFAGAYPAASLTATTTGDIDKAKANKSWLILVFHKIVTTTPGAATECLQSDFNAIVDKIVSSGVACMPIGEALNYF